MSFETVFGRLKVKITLEGHINKLVRDITPNQNNLAQLFFLTTGSAI